MSFDTHKPSAPVDTAALAEAMRREAAAKRRRRGRLATEVSTQESRGKAATLGAATLLGGGG